MKCFPLPSYFNYPNELFDYFSSEQQPISLLNDKRITGGQSFHSSRNSTEILLPTLQMFHFGVEWAKEGIVSRFVSNVLIVQSWLSIITDTEPSHKFVVVKVRYKERFIENVDYLKGFKKVRYRETFIGDPGRVYRESTVVGWRQCSVSKT